MRILRYILILLFSHSALADDHPRVTITYYHYPPHIRVTNGIPSGRYINQLNAVAQHAGLDVNWLPSSLEEEADLLDEGRRAICTTGRMPTPERAKKWVFLPYVFDIIPGDIVLTRFESVHKVRQHKNILALVENSHLTGTLLESGIYGSDVDTLLKQTPSWITRTAKSDFQLMNMVLAGRAHYTIVPIDQWNEAKLTLPGTEKLVPIRDFGTHPDYPIYIACSKAVAKETLSALSAGMANEGFEPGPIPE